MPVDNEQVIRQAYKIAEDRISRGRRGRRQGGPPAGRHRRAGQDGDLRPRAV